MESKKTSGRIGFQGRKKPTAEEIENALNQGLPPDPLSGKVGQDVQPVKVAEEQKSKRAETQEIDLEMISVSRTELPLVYVQRFEKLSSLYKEKKGKGRVKGLKLLPLTRTLLMKEIDDRCAQEGLDFKAQEAAQVKAACLAKKLIYPEER